MSVDHAGNSSTMSFDVRFALLVATGNYRHCGSCVSGLNALIGGLLPTSITHNVLFVCILLRFCK